MSFLKVVACLAFNDFKNSEVRKFGRRRKMKRWSLLEEDTLRTGVERYVLVLIKKSH